MTRFVRAAISVAVAAALLSVLPAGTRAQTPLYFPRSATLDTTMYTLRMAGTNRYATAAALAIVSARQQRTDTGFPFNEADATNDTKAYGFGACPKAVVIAAGDTVADALAAASIKDLGRLTIDGQSTIDTTNAVLLLTQSGRQGGTDLSGETITALGDLRDSCGTFDAVVFGSELAVPDTAFTTLDDIANRVARVAGSDRFDTARRIGIAVNAARGPVEVVIHKTANTPTKLPDTVFLAEGLTGADALALGPFAAGNNVPILLTQSNALPLATRNALLAIRPDNIVVVGGTAVIPQAQADEAAQAAGGAKIERIAGADRYDTSVKIAEVLFNEYPITSGALDPITGAPPSANYSNVMWGVARSEGSGIGHTGFPDALASAYFLDTASDKAVNPIRYAPPVERNTDKVNQDNTTTNVTMGGTAGARRAALLLTQRATLPAQVNTLLTAMFPSATRNSTSAALQTNANHGGFGFVFGGEGAVAQAVVLNVALRLSGGGYVEANRSDQTVKQDATKVFYTSMTFEGYTSTEGGGVDAQGAFLAGDKVCALRNALTGAQFLSAYQVGAFAAVGRVDYQDTTAWPQFQSRFACFDVTNVSSDRAQILSIGPSGRETPPRSVDWSAGDAVLKFPAAVADDKADTVTNGQAMTTAASIDLGGGGTSTAEATWTGPAALVFKGTSYTAADYTLRLNLTRTDPPSGPGTDSGADDRITYTGNFTVRTGSTLLFTANLEGEAVGNASPFKLVGMYSLGIGSAGGMRMTLETPDASTFKFTDFVLDGTA